MPSYTLKFSDPNNTATIIVPGTDVGPGKNNYSTSLDLVGPGYINYGKDIAQNFVKLLENFSSPFPPVNAIEGQLWYDTSNPSKGVLRVNNGTVTGTRWQNASGIYQQPTDPLDEYSSAVTEGDMWIDTSVNQVKIRYGNEWSIVGPNATSGDDKTGSEAVFLESDIGNKFPVILHWANGKVVEVISFNDFTPRSVIDGFTTLKVGVNLTSKNNAKYYGTAERASNLIRSDGVIVSANDILKNRSSGIPGGKQIHTGTFIIETGNGGEKFTDSILDGLVVFSNEEKSYIHSYCDENGGFINYVGPDTTFDVGFKPSAGSYLSFNKNKTLGINTNTVAGSSTLDVNGSGRFAGTLTVNISSTSNIGLSVVGTILTHGKLQANSGIVNSGETISQGKITVGVNNGNGTIIEPITNNTYDIGSASKPFRNIYATSIISASTGTGNITIYGTVSAAGQLVTTRKFKIQGQVQASEIQFNGTSDVTFDTVISSNAISNQVSKTDTNENDSLLILDSTDSTLKKTTKGNFLSDVYGSVVPTGSIIPYAGTVSPDTLNWLVANGQEVSIGNYPNLFAICQNRFGIPSIQSNFKLPNVTAGLITIPGLIYLIKT